MKLNIDLKYATPPEWVDVVLSDFDAFLLDHANCERKASAMAMSFIAKYPDRTLLIPELIETAIEELEHYQSVYKLIEGRKLRLPHKIAEDLYMKKLHKFCHSGRNERFLDRLLIASLVETRGAERFRLVADALEEIELKKFYKDLWVSEAKHGHLFVKMALHYFDEKQVYDRLEWWMDIESEVIKSMPLTPALH